MIAVVDYGVGNLFSLSHSLSQLGQPVQVTGDPGRIAGADRVILPGVGAFGDAAAQLRRRGLDQLLIQLAGQGKPILGICLGMQLLLEKSYEYGEHQGLGLIPGEVRPIAPLLPAGYKVPHMGWNQLVLPAGRPAHPLFAGLQPGAWVYFVHSYSAHCPPEALIAQAEHGALLTAAVARGNVMGVQFHPEKSGQAGLAILRAFCAM